MKYWLFLSLLVLLTGCYRCPNEWDSSPIPTVNNPELTHERCGFLPSAEF